MLKKAVSTRSFCSLLIFFHLAGFQLDFTDIILIDYLIDKTNTTLTHF